MFSEEDSSCEEINLYVKLFLSACNAFSKAVNKLNKGEKSCSKKRAKRFIFISNNVFSVFNMPEMVRLHGSVREIWESINKSYVHPVKDKITVMKNTDTYMPTLLTKLH